MRFRKFASDLHLWLGLITAPLVFFVCLTGTIIVFSDEIMELSAGKARYVAEVKDKKLPVEDLVKIMKEKFPTRKNPTYMVTYRDPARTVRFNSYDPEIGLRMVYIDPYTGKILKDDVTIYFFYITAHLHNSLLIHGIGEWIIDISTIIFLIALITGLIMWWPRKRSKKAIRYSLTVNWRVPFRRLNSDLHRVVGMYSMLLLIVLSLTGLMIAFKPLFAVTANAFGGNASIEWNDGLAKYNPEKKSYPVNEIIDEVFETNPDKNEIQYYTYFDDKWGYYAMNVAKKIGLKSAMNNQFFAFDRYSGEQLNIKPKAQKNKAVDNAIWTLHMGNWMGLGGKIITFLGGLIATLLPVSGFYIWWDKRRRNKNERKLFSSQL